MIITPPSPKESFGYFDKYMQKAAYQDLIQGLKESSEEFLNFIDKISDTQLDFRYQPDKWNIREIVQHIIDCERVFSYRALSFARKDKTPLPGFEENDYARESNSSARDITDLMVEFKTVRKATIELYKSFDESMIDAKGTANNNELTPRAIGFIMIGHVAHHQEIIQERYLS
jgi:hypothetical protein